MGRSGYHDDLDSRDLAMWRGRVASAIRGKRGQRLLIDTVKALDAMPEKRLISHELRKDGEVCTLGAVLVARGADPDQLDPEEHDAIGEVLDVSQCLVREIEYLNDEHAPEDPEKRWRFMREKIASLVKPVQIAPDA